MNRTMCIYVPTMNADTYDFRRNIVDLPSCNVMSHQEHDAAGRGGYLPMAQWALEDCGADILGILHDDLLIHERGWHLRVLNEFEDESVMAVGFGGATELGHEDIYKLPYDYRQLARGGYRSNDVEAEAHGIRFSGAQNVAVLDSFALFIRRADINQVGGWPVAYLAPSHCGDLWLGLTAARLGKRTRVVGVSCQHFSGGRGAAYPAWIAQTKWQSDENCHRIAHRLVYDQFRDVLPLRIKP